MVIAKVNDVEVSSEEVEREVKNIVAQYQNSFTPEQMEANKPKIRQQAVESTINKYLLNAEVAQQKIEVENERVEKEFDAIIKRFPSKDAFDNQLKQVGVTAEQIKSDLEQQLKVDVLVRAYVEKKELKVEEADISKFYNDNPKEFQMPLRVKASHILMNLEEDASADLKAQKRLELSSILGKIEKGDDFAKLAQQHSDCPSKEQGGDLDFFDKGKMVKPFEDAAFELKVGEVSEIVETKFGLHLIKVTDRKEEEVAKLEDVKEQLAQHLVATKEQEAFIQFVDTLRKAAKIEYGKAV